MYSFLLYISYVSDNSAVQQFGNAAGRARLLQQQQTEFEVIRGIYGMFLMLQDVNIPMTWSDF